MYTVVSFRDMDTVSQKLDPRVFSIIRENQTESFECFDTFCLLAFDYFDVKTKGKSGGKVLLYSDRDSLFVFCKTDSVKKKLELLFSEKKIDKNPSNELLLYHFFTRLLWGDMDFLESMEQELNDREEQLLTLPEREATKKIFSDRRHLLRLKRYYEQLDMIFDEMSDREGAFLSEEIVARFSVLGARCDRYLSAVRNLQEIVNQQREAYQTGLSIRQNELMRIFTVVTSVFLPLSLIASWYGMNFSGMPELDWKYGYPAVIAVSGGIAFLLLWYFRRKKWL